MRPVARRLRARAAARCEQTREVTIGPRARATGAPPLSVPPYPFRPSTASLSPPPAPARQTAGATPVARLKARLKAASEA
jgi:hypothetical protein